MFDNIYSLRYVEGGMILRAYIYSLRYVEGVMILRCFTIISTQIFFNEGGQMLRCHG